MLLPGAGVGAADGAGVGVLEDEGESAEVLSDGSAEGDMRAGPAEVGVGVSAFDVFLREDECVASDDEIEAAF
ncbi:MAG: hypothetical protein ACYCVD_00265 [Desulfitobacteriaceae bacterium]